MKDRAVRRHESERVIKNRLKQVKAAGSAPDNVTDQPHRMSKQHPFDCGNARCGLCHSDKNFKKPKISDLRNMDMGEDIDG